jgi:phosphoribosylglycinamide formyltransferase 1
MTNRALRFVIVASTGGSVMNELLKNDFFKSHIFSIVSDRQCLAIEKAKIYQIKTHIFFEKDKYSFSNLLLDYLKNNNVDYIISFFTKLFVGDILNVYKDKIINLHPSLLPAFKGMNSIEDSLKYGNRFGGSTIHFIDENMDEGKIISQTIFPIDHCKDTQYIRHKIFEQQCKSLLQVVKWIVDQRISIDNERVMISNTKFNDYEYSPNLDFIDAVTLKLPFA